MGTRHGHTAAPTSQHHPPEDGVVPVQGAAVPAVVTELILALTDPLLGSLPDGLHDVGVPLAQLPLLVHQPWDVVTDHPRPQRPDVPAGRRERCGGAWRCRLCAPSLLLRGTGANAALRWKKRCELHLLLQALLVLLAPSHV